MTDKKTPTPNRLVHENSPYLRQHAHNPVDWYPWGEEALERAQSENLPILLSIGYSACHWCHVMERESFEDPETADLMNRHFVNIKVDREERPDLDSIYMNYVQMTTGSGGWPMTVFLTPEQVPFYGGTYFPPTDRFGRPSFRRVLEEVSKAYSSKQAEISRSSPEIVRRLDQSARFELPEGEIEANLLEVAANQLSRNFDPRNGGFGTAPKFPSAMALRFLLSLYQHSGSPPILRTVEASLSGMANGGMYDQLGGGFHRYAVDEHWLIPHFEKMLYDNALLAPLYLEASRVTGNTFFGQVGEETLDWVIREMRSPEGAFYSAQDADTDGEEGKTYTWSMSEIEDLLEVGDRDLFTDFYGVSSSGNFEGSNVLHRRYQLEGYARSTGITPGELEARLARCRRRLLDARKERPQPATDDKSLASWNGLMLYAFSRAALILGREDYLQVATVNAEFLLGHMFRDGKLFRSWKEGQIKHTAYLEDYAAVIHGLLALYEATGVMNWLNQALRLMEVQDSLFRDAEAGDYYFTAADHEKLLVRQKEFLDNATPSGNSLTALNLLRLSRLLDHPDYWQTAEKLLSRVSLAASRHPLAFGNWLQAIQLYLGPTLEVVAVGSAGERKGLLRVLADFFLPNQIVAHLDPEAPPDPLPALLQGKTRIEDQPALYFCEDYVCKEPFTDTAEAGIWLRNRYYPKSSQPNES